MTADRDLAAVAAEQGALPMPAGPGPLSDQRLAEMEGRLAELDANRTLRGGTWTASPVDEKSVLPPAQAYAVEDVLRTKHSLVRSSVGTFGEKLHAEIAAHAPEDVRALLAEVKRLRDELGQMRAARDVIAQLHRDADSRLGAVLDICDREQRNAMRWQDPIPVPEWVAPVQRAALGDDKRAEAAR